MRCEKFFPKFSIFLLIVTLTLSLIIPLPIVNAALDEYSITLSVGDTLDVDTGEIPGDLGERDLIWELGGIVIGQRDLYRRNSAMFSFFMSGYQECDASSVSFNYNGFTEATMSVGYVFLIRTNRGYYAKIQVEGLGPQITLKIVYQNDGSTNLCSGLAILGLNNPTGDIPVCTEFTVEIPITNLPLAGMWNFQYELRWNPNYMEYRGHTIVDNGWAIPADSVQVNEASGILTMKTPESSFIRFSEDAVWLRIDFHCLGAGTSSLVTLDGYFDYSTGFEGYPFQLTETACNQRGGIISPKSSVVGGYYASVNSLAVLSPYLALVSLIGIIVTVLVTKKGANNN